MIGPNGQTCQPVNCTPEDFKIVAYEAFSDGCTVGEMDLDWYTIQPYLIENQSLSLSLNLSRTGILIL